VFFDPVTLRLLTWHFPIPISTDNSFQAETYVAWVVLSSMVAGVSWVMAMGDYTDRKSVTFCDSLSYISALLGKKKYDMDDFVSSMIGACRNLISKFGVSFPKHLYSHIEGTMLDDLLDVADSEAKIGASLASPTVGYFAGLQPPMAVVTRQGRQVHDLRLRIMTDLEGWYHNRHSPALALPHFAQYAEMVSHTDITMEDHAQVLAIRHGVLSVQKGTECVLCRGSPKHRGLVPSCPMAWLYWMHHAYNLARVIPTIYDGWSRCIPTELGVLVLYPPGSFCVRVAAEAERPSEAKFAGFPAPLPVFVVGHTGDITSGTHRALQDKGISQPMFLALLHTVVQHTVWFTRRSKVTSLPILPTQVVENRNGVSCTPLVRYLDTSMPLGLFRYMSTTTVLERVWPEIPILRALYTEGILSYNWDPTDLTGRPGRPRDRLFCTSPSRLPTHLANPTSVDQYLQSPPLPGRIPGQVTYIITNSRSPHGARQVSQFACLWEVAWEGGEMVEHFAFWSPSNAPVSAVAYATVVHTLFEVLAQALGFRCKRTFRTLSMAMPVAP
jgi:hypothetical protein